MTEEINYLEMPMLNGKKLGDCTGAEVERFAELHAGFARVARGKFSADPEKFIEYVRSREPGYRTEDIWRYVCAWPLFPRGKQK